MATPHALPLPIAALLRRARNATDPTRRHLAAYYAWEASVRLAVAAEPPADVSSLAMPSVGHFVKAMPPRPGSITEPALLALHALLAEVGTEQRSSPRSTSAHKLLTLLPAYRNKVIGHGSTRTDAFNEAAARAFLEALTPAWRLGIFLPQGAVLLFVDQVEIDAGGARRARLVRLEGLASEREGEASVGEEVRPERVYVRKDESFSSLHPWVLFEGGEERERVLFFNGYRNAAEYLDYVTGDIVKSKALSLAFPSLDVDVKELLEQERGERAPLAARSPAKEEARRPGLWKAAAVSAALLIAGVGGAVYWKSHAARGPEATGAGGAEATDSLVPRISEDLAVQSEFRRGIESMLEADIYAAESALVSVRDKAPREPWVHAALAMIHGVEEHYEDAQRELDEAIALSRGRSDRQAELFAIIDGAHKADVKPALAAWKEYGARHGKSFLEALVVAHYFINRGSAAERLARFEDVVAIDRRHAITYLLESRMHLHQRRFEAALAAVGRGIELRPTSPWLLAQRGITRMVMGEQAAARADLEEALARKGPFTGHVAYTLALLGAGTPEDEAQRKREVDALLATKNIDDRLQFMCSHGSALMRKGRMREGDALLDAAVDLAAARGKTGTVLRCALWPVWFEDALGRYDRANAKLDKLAGIWEGFGLTKSDGENARVLLKQIKGMLAADRGDVAAAEAALGELVKLGRKQEDLVYRIALAKKQVVEVLDAAADDFLFIQARRVHTQGRMLELAGKPEEAEKAYGKLLGDRLACMNTEQQLDFPCGAYVADGLVRLASRMAARKADADALGVLDALAAMWPHPDEDLPVVQRAAALRQKLGRGL